MKTGVLDVALLRAPRLAGRLAVASGALGCVLLAACNDGAPAPATATGPSAPLVVTASAPDAAGQSAPPAAAIRPGAAGSATATASTPPAHHVGRAACAACHPTEHALWTGSHHDLAMDVATDATVLGDFGDVTFTHRGVTSTFSRRRDADGVTRFTVRTDGPDGALREYDVTHTFGADPLQQYLVPFGDGRWQVLPLCWDTRPPAAGGQRWFHLLPDERIPAGDALHWTGPAFNWNHMCAECHSTELRKGWRDGEQRFETTWSEIDVSCEACHGPGSRHVEWAERAAAYPSDTGRAGAAADLGLLVDLRGDGARWVFTDDTGIATRDPPRTDRTELDTCARCHARRDVLVEGALPGLPLTDTHRPVLLEEGLYHPDGQILDEVYVYGSFLQSRMHAAGVTCSDCHDPHSLRLSGSPDGVCARCHLPERFAAPSHHGHEPDSPGSSCVACHMPERSYMVVDPRRDHRFGVPRPDLAHLGVPDACTGCHADRDPRWAADAIAAWREPGWSPPPHFGTALAAGRAGAPGAGELLAAVVDDATQPGIARATAASLLGPRAGRRGLEALARATDDPDPLVRYGALSALEGLDGATLLALGAPRLSDPSRLVRTEAARLLAGAPPERLSPQARTALAGALAEYRAALAVNGDRAAGQLALGVLATRLGDLDAARAAYETARRLDPSFVPAYINLADALRAQGRDAEGEKVLLAARRVDPSHPDVPHALGLLLVRKGRHELALDELRRAAELAPDVPRYGYALALALAHTGARDEAVSVLESLHADHPGDRDVLFALTTTLRDAGRRADALEHARRLLALDPQDPEARGLVASLERPAR